MTKPPAALLFSPGSSNASAIDASAQASTLVLGLSPAMSTALGYQQASFAAGLAMLNAVNAQHNQYLTTMAAGVMGVERLYSTSAGSYSRLERKLDKLISSMK